MVQTAKPCHSFFLANQSGWDWVKGSGKALPLKLAGKIDLPFLFIVAHELKCYKCFSTISWEDCETNNEKKTCEEGQERCIRAYTEYGGSKNFTRDCLDTASCDNKGVYLQTCMAASNSTCELTCCPGELCNNADVHIVSILLMMICAVMDFTPLT